MEYPQRQDRQSGFGLTTNRLRLFCLSSLIVLCSVFAVPSLIQAQGTPCQYNVQRLAYDIIHATLPYAGIVYVKISTGSAEFMFISTATIQKLRAYDVTIDTLVVKTSCTVDTISIEKNGWIKGNAIVTGDILAGATIHARYFSFDNAFTGDFFVNYLKNHPSVGYNGYRDMGDFEYLNGLKSIRAVQYYSIDTSSNITIIYGENYFDPLIIPYASTFDLRTDEAYLTYFSSSGFLFPLVVVSTSGRNVSGIYYKGGLACATTVSAPVGNFDEVLFPDGTVLVSSNIVTGFTSSSTARIPTVYVCASDAPLELKAIAQYVCDGIADNIELNQASSYLNSLGGGLLQLEGNQFNTLATIYLSSNTTIAGHGYTLIKNTYTYSPILSSMIEVRSSAQKVCIKDISVQSPSSGATSLWNCVYVNAGVDNIIINHCSLDTSGSPVEVINFVGYCSNVYITENYLKGGASPIISLKASQFTVSNNIIYGNGASGHGLRTFASFDGTIALNKIYPLGGNGIYMESGSNNIDVVGNQVSSNPAYGYYIVGSSIVMTGNSVYKAITALALIQTNGNKEDVNSWDGDNAKWSDVNISSIVWTNDIKNNYNVLEGTATQLFTNDRNMAKTNANNNFSTFQNFQSGVRVSSISSDSPVIDINGSLYDITTSTRQFCVGVDSVPAVGDAMYLPNMSISAWNLISLCGFADTPATGADLIADCYLSNSASVLATIVVPIGCSSGTIVNISSSVPSGVALKARMKQVGSTIAGSEFRINGRYYINRGK